MYEHYAVMQHIAETPLIGSDNANKRFFRASTLKEIEELLENSAKAAVQGIIAMDDDDVRYSVTDNDILSPKTHYSVVIFKQYKQGDINSWLEAKKWCKTTSRSMINLLRMYCKKQLNGFLPTEKLNDFTTFNIGRLFDFWAIQLNFTVTEVICSQNFGQEYL